MDEYEVRQLDGRMNNLGCAVVVLAVCLFLSCCDVQALRGRVENLEKSSTVAPGQDKKDAK